MSHATNGRAREHRVSKWMQDRGWTQDARAAASKGPADLWMSHQIHGGALIQVGTLNKRLGPHDRERLVSAAERWGALPLLATSGPGIPTRLHVVTRDKPSTWTEFTP